MVETEFSGGRVRVSGRDTAPGIDRISPYNLAITLVALDLLCIALSGLAAVSGVAAGPALGAGNYVSIVVFSALAHVAIAHMAVRTYHPRNLLRGRSILWRGLTGVTTTFACLLLVGALTNMTDSFSRLWFLHWVLGTYIGIGLCRVVAYVYIETKLANGACVTRALLVTLGEGQIDPTSLAIKTQNRTRAATHIRLDGLDGLETLGRLVASDQPDAVIVEAPWRDIPAASERIRQALGDFAVEVGIIASTDGPGEILRVDHIGSRALFQLLSHPFARWSAPLKRIEDVTIATIALILMSPLLVFIAGAIRLDSPGPVLFRQVRRGFNGRLIEVWKFRSMYDHVSDPHASRQTARNDPRITYIGHFLRRTSLDELPQLLNVLQGSMSVVGPRPHALRTTAGGVTLEEAVDNYAARHRVKPGITGWAQVNGLRGELDTVEKLRRRVEYDIDYISRWSIAFDIKIILMTILILFYDRKAY